MKGFIASVITLSLLIGVIVWNGIWVHCTLEELTEMTDAVSAESADGRARRTEELFKKWKDCKHILGITISHTEIESIESHIISVSVYAENEEDSDFDEALALLRDELEYLHRSESLTLEGII